MAAVVGRGEMQMQRTTISTTELMQMGGHARQRLTATVFYTAPHRPKFGCERRPRPPEPMTNTVPSRCGGRVRRMQGKPARARRNHKSQITSGARIHGHCLCPARSGGPSARLVRVDVLGLTRIAQALDNSRVGVHRVAQGWSWERNVGTVSAAYRA
ncbi:hypothetical protein B0H15DRAFT_810614 [Mycena belliarum]|uniref:Uncharacterized protein n=1 Tax=Mycena belliarum TaxID=1033014 RepID=A0AAD6UGM8_9AGAR|nr:hypothetical protein B0H15DRAFT_810614 [Mycena belliae]